MRRGAPIAGALALSAILAWRAARRLPPAVVSEGTPPSPSPVHAAKSSGRGEAAASTGSAAAQLATLREILASRNDNDPRLDAGFNDLSPEARRLFREEYRRLPAERRNERGTIVYLLGRNPASTEDWEFLRGVVSEPPCLSLADCSRTADAGSGAPGDEVTLAYPALVALRQARRALEAARGSGSGDAAAAAAREATALVQAARASKTPAVARMAARLESRPRP